MTERTVAVKLRANVGDFTTNIGKARQDVRQLGTDIGGATGKSAQGFQVMGAGALAAGGAIAFGLGKAIGAASNFDSAMSQVAAVSSATGAEMGQLRDAALEAGEATVFSATEAATAEAELAKAGVDTADILGGALAGSLDLAAAGSLQLADSATIAAQAMNVFELQGKDVAHIADVLAAGANKSAADVGQLGDALRQGGLVAAQTGLSLEDTVGTLAAFADRALIGSDAGTSLKTMLQRLTPQSAEAAEEMERLGISAYDSGGNFVGLEGFAQNLQDSLSGLTVEQRNSAMATIFGSDAVRAANVLYELGGRGIREYVAAVDDQGAAQRMAATLTDNLAGDLEQLGGSIETALINSGSVATDVLRDLAQSATDAVNIFNDAPRPVQMTAVALAGSAAAVALVGGSAVLAIPKIAAFKASLEVLSVSSARSSKMLAATTRFMTGPWGLALTAATVGLGLFAASSDDAVQANEELTASLDQQTGALTDNTRNLVINALEREGLLELADQVGLSLADVSDMVLAETEDFSALNDVLDGNFIVGSRLLGGLKAQRDELQASQDAWQRETEAGKAATDGAADLTAGLGDQTGALDEAAEATEELADAIEGLNDVQVNARLAAIGWEQALDDANEAIKENGQTLDIDTQAGRDNERALLALVDAGTERLAALKRENAGNDEVIRTHQAYRNELIKVAARMGMSKSEAKKYADQLFAIPDSVKTTVTVGGFDLSKKRLAQIAAAIKKIPNNKTVFIDVRGHGSIPEFAASGGYIGSDGAVHPTLHVTGFPGGGMVTGPGGPREDRVLIAASPGEFIVNAAATGDNLAVLDAINRGLMVTGGTRAHAGSPAGTGPGAAPVVVQLVSDGSRMGDLMLQALRHSVRVRGGNVQVVVGQ